MSLLLLWCWVQVHRARFQVDIVEGDSVHLLVINPIDSSRSSESKLGRDRQVAQDYPSDKLADTSHLREEPVPLSAASPCRTRCASWATD